MCDLQSFEKIIGYKFKDISLLKQALTHASYSNEHPDSPSYERLEFLGDSVLGMIVADKLYNLYPEVDEGILSKMKSYLVKEESLYKYAIKLKFDKFIMLGRSEMQSAGNKKASIVSDCFESVLGAIYKDSNIEVATNWINSVIDEEHFFEARNNLNDYKTTFQEYIQQKGNSKIEYRLVDEKGPAHDKIFTVAVYVNGKFYASGSAGTKKQAEQNAAKKALNMRWKIVFKVFGNSGV